MNAVLRSQSAWSPMPVARRVVRTGLGKAMLVLWAILPQVSEATATQSSMVQIWGARAGSKVEFQLNTFERVLETAEQHPAFLDGLRPKHTSATGQELISFSQNVLSSDLEVGGSPCSALPGPVS